MTRCDWDSCLKPHFELKIIAATQLAQRIEREEICFTTAPTPSLPFFHTDVSLHYTYRLILAIFDHNHCTPSLRVCESIHSRIRSRHIDLGPGNLRLILPVASCDIDMSQLAFCTFLWKPKLWNLPFQCKGGGILHPAFFLLDIGEFFRDEKKRTFQNRPLLGNP